MMHPRKCRGGRGTPSGGRRGASCSSSSGGAATSGAAGWQAQRSTRSWRSNSESMRRASRIRAERRSWRSWPYLTSGRLGGTRRLSRALTHMWLRDTLFLPVVWVVRYYGVEIAWWVKDTGNDLTVTELRHIGLQVLVISIATMAFFLWNYLSGVYGPT